MNRQKKLIFAGLAAVMVLGCSDTAWAQPQLTVSPQTDQQHPLAFTNIPVNSTSKSQSVQVSATGGSPTVIIQPDQASSWIVLSNSVLNLSSTPTALGVQVNTQGLQQGVTYQGSFTITIAGSSTTAVVYVSVSVGGASVLSANPSSLTFSSQEGAPSGTPSSTNVKLSVLSGPQLNYTLQVQTQDGANWLLLSSTSGTTGDNGFNVSVNPSALQPATLPATYTGTITAQSTTTNDSVQVSVSLTITSGPTLTASPSSLAPFLWQVGTNNPSSQQVTLAATGGAVQFTVRESPTVNWLVVTPLSGTAGATPATLTLSPVPSGASLQPNTYQTNVIVSSGGVDLITIPVKLIVSSHPLLRLSVNTLAYTAQFGAAQGPADQQAMVTSSDGSTGENFNFTSDSAWLTATTANNIASTTSGTGSTPATLTIHVDPTGLQVGSYTGTIMVQPANGDQYTEFITVSLSVTAAATLTAAPSQLLFSYQTGLASPAAQNVQIQSTGQPLQFTATPITTSTPSCPSSWLTVTSTSNTTPATLTVNVNTTGMTAGSCGGTIRVDYNSGAGPATFTIPVTVAVSAADKSELSISMPAGFGVETAQLGALDFTRQIALTSTDPASPVDFTAIATSVGGAWLFVSPGTGTTPQNLSVKISPSVLTAPGHYSGLIKLTSTSLPQAEFDIQVSLTITSNVSVSVAPASLTFNEAQNGPLPAAQTLTLTSAGGSATFTSSIQYNNGNNWLQLSPASGNASGPVQVSVLQNSFSPGTYTAQILFALQGASATSIPVNVTLHVTQPQTVSVSPQSLSFSYQIGAASPASQKITISSTNGSVNFSVGTTSSGWLSADVTNAATPKDVNVSVNTQGLTQPQTLNGSISISAPGVLANPITIPVTLTVTTAPIPQPITISSSASGVAGFIAPGEFITIKGNNLGPASPASGVSFQLNSKGGVDSTLAGVQVLFDDIPGTPTYVSAGQINVIVPYEIAGKSSTNVVVQYQNASSAPAHLGVAAAAPGLFTDNFTGQGQVAAINQNGTYNGALGTGFAPAPQGSIISVYATGGGQTNPPSSTGSVTPIPQSASDLLQVPGQVTATIGGQPADVLFAGAAPNLVTGVIQFNIRVPAGVSGNNVSISVSINGISSTLGTTIAVQ